MADFKIPIVSGDESADDLLQTVAKTQKLLNWIMQGRIDFKNVRAEGIVADNIKAGTITANEIAADTITADKMNVTELSAIAADLGTITAGIIRGIQIFGSYIATREGAYPRAELNDSDDLFAVYKTANNFSKFADNLLGSPGLVMSDPVTLSAIYNQSVGFPALLIQSTQDIDLKPGSGRFVFVPDWSQLYSSGDSQSLQSALDSINSTLSSLQSQITSLDSRVSALESA